MKTIHDSPLPALKIFLIPLLLFSAVSCAKKEDEYRKPNIIVIMADDISAKDFPSYGLSDPTYGDAPCVTPTLDMIKQEGVQFAHSWATPLCHPTRGMIMTGRFATRTGWWSNEFDIRAADPNLDPGLHSFNQTFGQLVKNAGYASQMVGKWQLYGTKEGFEFDEYVMTPGNKAARAPAQKNGKPSFYWNPGYALHNHPDYPESAGEEALQFETTWDDFAADIELKFIKDFISRQHAAEKPFFVYWPAHMGHGNWDYVYDRMGNPGVPERDEAGNRTGKITEPGMNVHVQYLDYLTKELIDELNEMGILDNTIIILTTDNATTPHGKGMKGVFKETGSLVPLYVYGPGLIKTRGETEELVSLADICPTIADLSGATLPEGYEFDGISLVPFLTGKTDKTREWIFSYNGVCRMVRTKTVMRDGIGLYWDIRDQKDQAFYELVEMDPDPELKKDIELIGKILSSYPPPAQSGPAWDHYRQEKDNHREWLERLEEEWGDKCQHFNND